MRLIPDFPRSKIFLILATVLLTNASCGEDRVKLRSSPSKKLSRSASDSNTPPKAPDVGTLQAELRAQTSHCERISVKSEALHKELDIISSRLRKKLVGRADKDKDSFSRNNSPPRKEDKPSVNRSSKREQDRRRRRR